MIDLGSWLLFLAVRYMRWRGEYNDEQVERIRNVLHDSAISIR